MARLTSDEKRKAILEAAARLVAETGTSVSTAKIARAAGVAEGTIFVYFDTKAALMNALLNELESELAAACPVQNHPGPAGREDIRRAWDGLIAWGAAHPKKWRAMKRLKVCELITCDTRRETQKLFADLLAMLSDAISRHARDDMSADYAGQALNALAEMTFDRIAAEPQRARHYTDLGFDLFWKGIAAGMSG